MNVYLVVYGVRVCRKCHEMEPNIIKTQRGGELLSWKGFLYIRRKDVGSTNNVQSWRCKDYVKYKCAGKVHMVKGEVVKEVEHSHVADCREEDNIKRKQELKKIAETTQVLYVTHNE